MTDEELRLECLRLAVEMASVRFNAAPANEAAAVIVRALPSLCSGRRRLLQHGRLLRRREDAREMRDDVVRRRLADGAGREDRGDDPCFLHAANSVAGSTAKAAATERAGPGIGSGTRLSGPADVLPLCPVSSNPCGRPSAHHRAETAAAGIPASVDPAGGGHASSSSSVAALFSPLLSPFSTGGFIAGEATSGVSGCRRKIFASPRASRGTGPAA